MTKLIVAFRNFGNARKNASRCIARNVMSVTRKCVDKTGKKNTAFVVDVSDQRYTSKRL